MGKKVLIVGTGGRSKYWFIDSLIRMGAEVVILDPAGKPWGARDRFPELVVRECSFSNRTEFLEQAARLCRDEQVTVVDTPFELVLEHCALLREHLEMPGLNQAQTAWGRRKSKMTELMDEFDIRHAPTLVFEGESVLNEIRTQAMKWGERDWILRPDRAGGKIGVLRLDHLRQLPTAYAEARAAADEHPYLSTVYYDVADKWVLSKYQPGYEVETEVLVDRGEVVELVLLLKTISVERYDGIEENRYVTPPPWLNSSWFEDLRFQVDKLAEAVWKVAMQPAGRERFVLHPEFRVDLDSKEAWLLEFAFRNGGGLNPEQIRVATGIDVFAFSASGALGTLTDEYLGHSTAGAAGYQMVFSDRPGKFEGLEGVKQRSGVKVDIDAPVGSEIVVPHMDVLACVVATGETPEEVERQLDSVLGEAVVIVDGAKIPVPTSEVGVRKGVPATDRYLSH